MPRLPRQVCARVADFLGSPRSTASQSIQHAVRERINTTSAAAGEGKRLGCQLSDPRRTNRPARLTAASDPTAGLGGEGWEGGMSNPLSSNWRHGLGWFERDKTRHCQDVMEGGKPQPKNGFREGRVTGVLNGRVCVCDPPTRALAS